MVTKLFFKNALIKTRQGAGLFAPTIKRRFKKMKEILTQSMNEKEIKEGLKLFKKWITLSKTKYTHANPLEQNCYTSGSYIIGVFFPNTVFETLPAHSHYEICSISKVGGELGLVYSLKDSANIPERARVYFNEFIFEDFTTLIYGSHYKTVKNKIEKRIKEYKKDIETLKNIKRVYKKDGGNFADTLRNFEGARIYFDFCILSPCVSSIKINYDQIYIYRDDEDKKARAVPTVEEVERLLKEKEFQYMEYLKREENELKNLDKNFLRFKKICQELKIFRNSVSSWYDFKNELDSMII